MFGEADAEEADQEVPPVGFGMVADTHRHLQKDERV
jgi:hypothetical protein